jgi:hypothetical protein
MERSVRKESERQQAIEARGTFMLPFMTPGDFSRLIAIGASDPNRGARPERIQK